MVINMDIKEIVDIKEMPNFNPKVKNGADSVSTGKVFLKETGHGRMPFCEKHGIMNKVTSHGIWRCLMCNEGCYENDF